MKKVLSFVLVLAMILGSVSMAFAADYKDQASITNKEAVGVLSGLKVLEGDANGFRPADTLTRAEAAAIIARLKLGRDDADALSASGAIFNDVPASHWAAGYITYCVSENIIAGNGDGTFSPSATLTVPAFGKMLLVCLGYDPTIEGLVGSNWEANTVKLMITADINVSKTGACTRDTAALMGLKALEADVVGYATKGTTVNVGGTIVSTGGSSAEAKKAIKDANDDEITYVTGTADGVLQLAESLYKGDLRKATADPDDFGNPAITWTYNNKILNKYVGKIGTFSKKPVATFTAKTKAADVNAALGGYQIMVGAGNTYKTINNTTKYANGTTTGAILRTDADGGVIFAADEEETLAHMIADQTANGRLVNVFASKGTITDVVLVNYTAAKVTRVTETKTYTQYALDTVNGSYRVYADGTDDTAVLAGDVAKDDYVTVYKPTGVAKVYIYPTTTVTGDQTNYTDKDGVRTVTLDGTQYTVSVAPYQAANNFKNGSDVKLYLDQYGYAIETKGASSSSYAYIASYTVKGETTLDGDKGSAKVRVVLEDGTVGDYDLATVKVTNSNTADYPSVPVGAYAVKNFDMYATAAATLNNKVVTYTISGTTFTAEKASGVDNNKGANLNDKVQALGNYDYDITAGQVKFGNEAANASTKFVAYNNDKNTATSYVGATNVPKVDDTKTFVVYSTSNDVKTATVIFADSAKTPSSKSVTYAYVDVSEVTTSKNGDDTIYSYVAYNKTADKITVTYKDPIPEDGIYEIDANNVVVDGLTVPNVEIHVAESKKEKDAQTVTYSGVKVNGSVLSVYELATASAVADDGTYFYSIVDTTGIAFVDTDAADVADNSIVFVVDDSTGHENEVIVIYVVDAVVE